MKTFLPLLFIYLFCIPFDMFGQNLVPNASFEIVRKMPYKKNNSIYCATGWMSPKGDGASDYYNTGGSGHGRAPRNIFGRQKPHSGTAYGGICIRKNFMEYVETKLSDTLIKGQDYLVEFYISRAERSIGSVKEFGVLFTKKIIMGVSEIGIATKPNIDFISQSKYRNKRKWIKLSAIYHAEGYETTINIGHFNYDESKRFKGIAHYYIDDVSVTLIKRKEDSIVSINIPDTIPKSFSPKLGEIVTLKNIFFSTSKSELLPESFLELDKLAQYLNETPGTSIKINGHTDKTGSEDLNKTLSESRAKAVADYLTLKGIDQSRIIYMGYGSAKPIATNDTDVGKQQNRRVEFIISQR